MKTKLFICLFAFCISSCNYLDYDESDFLEKEAVFSKRKPAKNISLRDHVF